MARFRLVVAALALSVLTAPTVFAAAQNYLTYGAEQFFRVQWESSRSRKGTPVVSGYIYNTYGSSAGNVRVLVEGLDASGNVVDRQLHLLPGTIPNDGRTYFEVMAPSAASHRVVVASWDWMRGGGGGGM